ncbi:MAG: PAS domain-containing protein, partial [Desulfovibrionales bacterium]
MDNEKEHDKLEKESLLAILSETEKLANVGGWEWGIGKDVWTFSDNWLRMHGCSKRHLRTLEFLPMAHPDDRANIQKAFDRAISEGCRYEIGHRIIHQVSGEILYIRACGAAKLDKDGVPVKMYGSSQDITDRKQAEQQLKESEARFRLLYKKAPLGYQSLDEKGHLIQVNQAWFDTLGYIRDEVIGRSFADFLHPDWRDHFKENFPRFKAIGEILGVEFEMVKKNGAFILVSINGKINKDEDGNFQQTHCILYDITERKQDEEALRRSENYYRALFETSGTAMFIVEENTIISKVNTNFETLSGYCKQEVEGEKSWTEFIHADDVGWMKEYHYLRQRDPRAVPVNYEFRFFVRNGELRHGYLTVDVIPDTTQSVVSLI